MASGSFSMIYWQLKWELAGLKIDMADIPKAMLIPVLGFVVGLLIAIFISYRKPREYENRSNRGNGKCYRN